METKMDGTNPLILLGFKSYYVVWKRRVYSRGKSIFGGLNRTMQYGNNQGLDAYCVTKRFKSYYVVWKPDARAKKKEDDIEFKSYYVVWKLVNAINTRETVTSLNRTMQYGNYLFVEVYFQKVHRFKSYYVVWKRRSCVLSHISSILFKSYYVVWKHSFEAQDIFYGYEFKSYYVVWKPYFITYEKILVFRFKSYYVVWKRDNVVVLSVWTMLFKSYYVVWKRPRPSPQHTRNIGFKSYYVVWKPAMKRSRCVPQEGLNRTMQYGNSQTRDAPTWADTV